MKYKSGIEVEEGDIVLFERSGGNYEQGVVVQIIQPNSEAAKDWSLSEGGILVKGGGLNLSITKSFEDDEEVVFVRRVYETPL
ncbi:MAG: hypothetical protein PUP92_20950 [Rhizonema sp. PD38]|nr:hypothetical protein [Rhizonema sp. PD38]